MTVLVPPHADPHVVAANNGSVSAIVTLHVKLLATPSG